MSGLVLQDGTVRFDEPAEAGQVYGKGFFGTPASGGGLTLDRYESVYLAEMGRVELRGSSRRSVAWPTVFRRAVRADPGFAVRYLVYRDLRQRGYVVRASPPPVAFTVLPRGGILHKTPSRYWVEAISERVPFDLARLFDLAERAQSAKKLLLLGLVDEESDLTYYRVRRPTPTGALPTRPLTIPAEGWLSEDRVTVHDLAQATELGKELAYGSRVGDRLELSLLEAAYLASTGQLTVRDSKSGRPVSLERIERRARRLDPLFFERLAAYRELRGRALVVKTGFKYGAHFRAYPRSPEHSHARYLVRAAPATHIASWIEVAGGVRVAQGVRKEFLVAGVRPDAQVRFLSLERVRP
ncbi:MAG TPA: tRNA-intron lyase [Thermoplasmata archaeon]|nr:tRNA-intron lyase [Thermoplasmata archaeon]